MNTDNIRKLVSNTNIDDAITELIKLTEKLSKGLYNKAIQLKIRHKNLKNAGLISDNNSPDFSTFCLDLLNFLSEIENYVDDSGEIIAFCSDYILNDNRTPFADRKKFKEIINKNIQTRGAKLIFIKGTPKSGVSYLEHYLIHLGKLNELFDVIRINVAKELDDPESFKGVSLAKLLSIGLNLDLNFDISEQDQFKFARFISRLKENLEKKSKIPVIFIHDFQKLPVITEDINRFISKIADEFLQSFPKVLFIVAGLSPELIPNWYENMRNYCPVYEIETIEECNVRECLKSIYANFGDKIKSTLQNSITEEEYIENMMVKVAIPPLNIASVGATMSDHLYFLNNS